MSNTAQIYKTEVNLAGLLEVLGTNLYSRPEVAVRELVQNAHDGCRRRELDGDENYAPQISVGTDFGEGRIWIEDNGAGMSADEVHQYLATIGVGQTREARQKTQDEGLIGFFGLGFLTAYMIGKSVEVITCSHKEGSETVRFYSESGRNYTLQTISEQMTGTRVSIVLKDDLADISDGEKLMAVLRQYCRLLTIPISFANTGKPINDIVPPWRMDMEGWPDIRKRKVMQDFALSMESWFEPIAVIPVESDGHGGGLLWIHDRNTYGSEDNRKVSVFIRGMLVAENERDLLPSWAGFVSGTYEAASLVPTASRESLQKTEEYQDVQDSIINALSSGLIHIAQNEPQTWNAILRRHGQSMLGAAIADPDFFDAAKEKLTLPTFQGEQTMADIVANSDGKIYVGFSEEYSADYATLIATGQPIIKGFQYGAAPFAALYAEEHGLEVVELGTSSAISSLFPDHNVSEDEKKLLEEWFEDEHTRLVISHFEPSDLPVALMLDRDAALKSYFESEKADKDFSQGILALARQHTNTIQSEKPRILVINMAAPAIRTLFSISRDRANLGAQQLKSFMNMIAAPALGKQSNPQKALQDFSSAFVELMKE